MTVPSPVHHVARFAKEYPGIWKNVDYIVGEKGKALSSWPKWCFLPAMAIDQALAAIKKPGAHYPDENRARVLSRQLSTLATWRLTQGIYRIDRTVLDELWETPITQEIPTEILFQIPEWCIYIETPGKEFFKQEMHGCFVYLDYDFQTERAKLQFLVDTPFPVNNLVPFDVDLVPGLTLYDCMIATWQRKFPGDEAEEIRGAARSLADFGALPQLMSVLLYICSIGNEVRENLVVASPRPRKTKNGWRYFPAEKPTELEIAYRIGAFLRRQEKRETDAAPGSGRRRSPSGHVRRGHWHLYWGGKGSKKDLSKRIPLLKWVHPVLVNAERPEDLTPVVRRVSSK